MYNNLVIKLQCEKLNKQRRSLMGMLASVHGKMDSVDQAISQARLVVFLLVTKTHPVQHAFMNLMIYYQIQSAIQMLFMLYMPFHGWFDP